MQVYMQYNTKKCLIYLRVTKQADQPSSIGQNEMKFFF